MSVVQMTREFADLMDVGSYAAARLIRTEINRMHNNAALESYKAMGLKEYKYLATLDCRTCAVCGALDGKVFKVSDAKTGVNFPPIHSNDRCTITPVVPGMAESGGRAACDPETGKNYMVPAGMTYEGWRRSIAEKYGADSIRTAQKKYWNRKSDAEQMKAMRKVLGKDVPNRIADFQQLKYNDDDSWVRLQQAYKDQPIRNRIQSDAQPKVIDEGKQGKHILGHNNYQEGKSYLIISMNEAQKLVDKFAGTGEILRDRKGAWKHQESIQTDSIIGFVVDEITREAVPTGDFKIHYGKSGTHIVPLRRIK
ncbi:MAG: polymorphic toxin type 50 domain-containing protein [Oscillospiraceae bacterium]|nr:polymorphic toxin type 50 domain-containing protein [Oscillospiraceae bacterium]